MTKKNKYAYPEPIINIGGNGRVFAPFTVSNKLKTKKRIILKNKG